MAVLLQWMHLFLMLILSIMKDTIRLIISLNYTITYKSIANNRLNTSLAKVIDNLTINKCAILCSQNLSRISFNFMKVNGELGKCEIPELTRISAQEGQLVTDANYSYFERVQIHPNPCDSNPCSYDGNCSFHANGNELDYECQCSFPMQGKACQDVICNATACSQFEDTFYFYQISDTSVNWTTAKSYCQDQMMHLATPKTNEAFKSVRNFLGNLYRDRKTTSHAYWIGLSRTSLTEPFLWIDDNSQLEANSSKWTPGHPNETNAMCVEMANTAKFKFFKMDEDPCGGVISNWIYGYICQLNFSATLK